MKNIKTINKYFYSPLRTKILSILSLVMVALCISCEDMLEEEPKAVAAELFYNTAEELEAGVNAIYSPMRGGRAEFIAVLDAHTDWGYGRGSRANYNSFSGFNSGNINVAAGRWNEFYLSIRNANFIIKNAPEASSVAQTDIDKIVGEAKFLRGMAYFDLVRGWDGVPLRTELNMNDIDAKKSTSAEVYDFVISDLLEAEKHLPEDPKDIGRPTVYAAKMLLADVYLNLGMYAEARDKADEVIKSNKFNLVPTSDIEDIQNNLFGPELLTSSEEIFSFKYTRQPGFGNWILFVLNHPSTGLFNFGGAYAHYSDASNKFYETWDDDDLRKSLWDQISFGLGATTLVSKKYIDNQAADRTGAGNDLPIYRYAEALLIYAEAATRASNNLTTEAMEVLNKVHRRSFGYDPEVPSVVDFNTADYDASSFVDLVLQERAYEFIFEGKRWFDLKRTGKAAATILDVKGINIEEKHYLWPIPTVELELNGAMRPEDQNPGY
ncbi:RagB/SusD family nutrient uptake outer membrane protein [Reichenbachiella sp. MALMAid0571]|uniref:RagB/SusD family nutrient uptake outer membrane protein n=1 Tax=Reichenbachiella sp. MALMAid0571 TaxID=3143939 RepID=UPI0032DF569D